MTRNLFRAIATCAVATTVALSLEAVLFNSANASDAVVTVSSSDPLCLIDCHSVGVETGGECEPGNHKVENSGGTGGGINHNKPDQCFPGTCAEKHTCGEGGEEEAQFAALALDGAAVSGRKLREVLNKYPRMHVNAERQMLQLIGRGEKVAAQIPLTATQVAAVAHANLLVVTE